MPIVAIILVNWNGKKDTIECLSSLGKITAKGLSLHILVVDNHSSDDSVSVIRKKFPHVTVLENKTNEGFVGGNNRGIKYALKHNAEYIFLLNNDTTVDPSMIQELVTASKEHADNAIIAPKIYFSPGYEFHKNRYHKKDLGKVLWYAGGLIDWDNVLPTHRGVDQIDTGQYDTVSETDFVSGCAFFAHKDIFKTVGLFDKRYFAYYEDVALSVRAKQKGFVLLYAPKAVCWHKNAGSSGGSGSSTHQYYMVRNQLLFGMHYAPLRARIALIRQSLVILFKGNTFERWGVIDYFIRRFGKSKRTV